MAHKLLYSSLKSRCATRQVVCSPPASSLRRYGATLHSQAENQFTRQQQGPPQATATAPFEPQYEQHYPSTRAFAEFAVYKGKGAMKTTLISPTWRPLSSGQVVERQGTLLLEFAEPMPGSGTSPGERRYNWEQKQTFALSALELGALLDPDPDGIKDMYHDPNKGSSNEGTLSKSLQIKQMERAGSYYFGLTVQDSSKQSTKIGVSVSRQEMAVLRCIATYLIPHLLGFDEVAASINVKQAPSQQFSSQQVPGFDTPPF